MSNLSFDQAWKQLQQLVTELEDETLPLDELADKVKKAKTLILFCEGKLRGIEEDLQASLE